MALADLDKIPPREAKPNLVVDLSRWAEGASITFRAPGIADLVPGGTVIAEMKVAFPEFAEELLRTIVLMGRCYVPDANDPPTLSASRRLGKLAREQHEIFLFIAGEFSRTFPQSVEGFAAEGNA